MICGTSLTLNVLDGATATTGGLIGDVTLGEGLGSSGTFNVGGTGSSALMDDLLVGYGGVGFLNVTEGGLVDQSVGADPDARVAVSDLSANIGAGILAKRFENSLAWAVTWGLTNRRREAHNGIISH